MCHSCRNDCSGPAASARRSGSHVDASATAASIAITAPNTAVTYAGGSVQAVTWDVANTNLPPVQTTDVRIRLSIDGGHTYAYDFENRLVSKDGGAYER